MAVGRRFLARLGAATLAAASLNGHQLLGPRVEATAGTITPRTTKVSNINPAAMPKPICCTANTGEVTKAKKVAAKMMPAEEITGPVTPTASATECLSTWMPSSRRRDIKIRL